MWKQNLSLFKHVPTLDENIIIEAFENETTSNFQLVESKQEVLTLQAEINGRQLFIHSKYNPLQEAERIVRRAQTEIEARDHIIFYGVGLGYHIEKVFEAYPNKQCTIIEPNLAVFLRFLESRSLDNFPANQVRAIYVPSKSMSLQQFITGLMTDLRGDATVVILPAYERIFKNEVAQFFEIYQNALKTTRSNVVAQRAFSKRWTINSLMNVPKTVRTKNIREKATHFKGRPIIIAAAGPSLYEDLDHLKYIKEKGLAYIFAVGSANKAFIAHDVTPDAVLTYDPQPHNVNVFRELNETGRTDIPMIYGTSVGFETTDVYPGPLFHFVNSADTVTNYYLGKPAGTFDVHDSTTITLVAIQVAEMLEASTIILAGQNLAFKENRYYAEGINHWDWQGEVRKDKEGREILLTEDVHGNPIETNESLNNMRRDIELYIESRSELQIINTTKKGAAIKGAPFTPIEKLIKEELTKKVVIENWYEQSETAITETTIKQTEKMERAIEQMYDLLTRADETLQKAYSYKDSNNVRQISNAYKSFDQLFNRIMKNAIYEHFIAPVLKFEFEQLKKLLQQANAELHIPTRVEQITTIYTNYLNYIQEIFNEMIVHIQATVHPDIFTAASVNVYAHHDGVFHYEGNWERETVSFPDLSKGEHQLKLSETISTKTTEKGAKIKFRFEGTLLQVFAQTNHEFTNDLVVTIDGSERKVRTRNRKQRPGLSPKLREQVLEVRALSNDMHEVTIELLSDEPFHFQGIAINEGGRVYHVDEVTVIEELEVGKRIRCHYEATVNKVGKFNTLGKATGDFIPVESTPNPDGDFYFIMVDDEDGEKKLIADRNVQNYISFNTLMEQLPNTKLAGIKNSIIRLLQVSEEEGGRDEWLEYIRDNEVVEDSELVWNHVRDVDKGRGLYSMANNVNGDAGVYSKCYHFERYKKGTHSFASISCNDTHRLWGFKLLVVIG